MATAAQQTANRNNSQFSTGPRTAEGKARSSSNATKHGLTGRNLILPGERREDFDRLLNGLESYWGPANSKEHELVDDIAEATWRLERFHRIEHTILEMGCEHHIENGVDPDRALAATFLERGKEIDKLQRYANSLLRQREKLQRELDRMQYERLGLERAEAEAQSRAQLAPAKLAEPQQPSVATTASAPERPLGFVSQEGRPCQFLQPSLNERRFVTVPAQIGLI